MKNSRILLGLLLAPTLLLVAAIAPSTTPNPVVTQDYLAKLKPELIAEYKPDTAGPQVVHVSMDFASSKPNNAQTLAKLKGKQITEVTLLYTNYRLSERFNQPTLNRARFDTLRMRIPYLFNQSMIRWRVVGQTACRKEETAKRFFHGFRIVYRESGNPKTSKMEIDWLKRIMGSDSLGKTIVVEDVHKTITVNIKKKGYDPILKINRKKGKVYDRPGILGRKPHYQKKQDTVITKKSRKVFEASSLAEDYYRNHLDSTVRLALERNESDWKGATYVLDVTGSMSPFTAQVLLWAKLSFEQRKGTGFVLFNDGDSKEDPKKALGKTGGIYTIKPEKASDLEEKTYAVMGKGNGGDIPENNIEAILKGLSTFPKSKCVVMVADNFAAIKDLIMASQIKVPVHIILCHTKFGINPDYLKLARLTKGTVHTMQDDVKNLHALKEGETVQFGEQTFVLSKGKFVLKG